MKTCWLSAWINFGEFKKLNGTEAAFMIIYAGATSRQVQVPCLYPACYVLPIRVATPIAWIKCVGDNMRAIGQEPGEPQCHTKCDPNKHETRCVKSAALYSKMCTGTAVTRTYDVPQVWRGNRPFPRSRHHNFGSPPSKQAATLGTPALLTFMATTTRGHFIQERLYGNHVSCQQWKLVPNQELNPVASNAWMLTRFIVERVNFEGVMSPKFVERKNEGRLLS